MVVFLAEQKKFALYEYLVFFWKKKVFFLIIPLLFTLLGFGASYLVPKEGKYVGSASIFTGSIKLKALTNPANIVSTFGKDVKGEIDAFVSSESYVKFKIYSDNKEELEKDLQNMTAKIEEKLVENYELRYSITEEGVKSNEIQLEQSNDVVRVITDKLENRNNLAVEQIEDITTTLEKTEAKVSELQTRIQNMKSDLAFFEKPGTLDETVKVTETNTYKLELSLAGLILGIFATFFILMLWKYINEARRYSSHD